MFEHHPSKLLLSCSKWSASKGCPCWNSQHTHLWVAFALVQAAPPSTGRARMKYVSGSLPVPLLHDPLHGPDASQVALQATGLQGFPLMHVPMRVSPCIAGHSVPFLAAGVVITYLHHTSAPGTYMVQYTLCRELKATGFSTDRTVAPQPCLDW